MSVALVTGATGQDGSYLVERLLAEGLEVHGLVRTDDLGGPLPEGLVVHEVDLDTDPGVLTDLVARVGIDDWSGHVEQDPRFMRPAEVDMLVGDASKARERLGWKPTVAFHELVEMMVDNDLALLRASTGR